MVYGLFQTSLVPACQYGAVHSSELLLLPDPAGALSPQPGQISPRGRDCSTPSGATAQWWCRRWVHAPVGNVPELAAPWVWSIYHEIIPLWIWREGFLAHARVSASKGTTQTASSSSWDSPWVVTACPLSRSPSWCLEMKASELQGCPLTSCKEAVSR